MPAALKKEQAAAPPQANFKPQKHESPRHFSNFRNAGG